MRHNLQHVDGQLQVFDISLASRSGTVETGKGTVDI